MLQKFEAFLNRKLVESEGIYDRYRRQLIMSEAFGAYSFYKTISNNSSIQDLWNAFCTKFDKQTGGR